ncbi:hypothetical protein V5N11_031047 [Cardamine amara subsp. amara]|uniref:TPPC8 C-terminal Ig-like domain-containing protein n=1 Tax=Cardamine amara subsp. amara TaxID=228776 RepID=A0ABD0ZQ49_CARAN
MEGPNPAIIHNRNPWKVQIQPSPPFIWSGLSSTKVQIQPLSTTEIPLQISVFSPGIYDLSSYKLNWELSGHENASSSTSSGTCQGYPYYLTVLQSESRTC